MYWLLNLWGLVKVAWQRQRSYIGLVVALVVGFIVAVALVVSIPLYSEAVGYRILRTELEPDAEGTRRPPFAYMFSRSVATNGEFPVDAFQKVDEYFRTRGPRDLGLPPEVIVQYVTSDKLRMLPPDTAGAPGEPLRWVNVGYASGIGEQVEILEGSFPRPVEQTDERAEALVHERTADEMGLQVGEEYLVLEKGEAPDRVRLPIRIAGVWRARNANDPYWFIRPESLQDLLIVPEETYNARLLNEGPAALYHALWYYVLDGTSARSRHVPGLVGRIAATLRRADGLLPGVELRLSPQKALERQYSQVRLLTISLIVFSIPILGLVAYFIIMVAGMVVQRQQNEIAVLRGRGVSRAEVLGIYLLEGIILGAIALAAGLFLGRYAALLMGWTRSFLQFTPREDIPVELSPEGIRGGLWVIGLTLAASVLPAVGAAGHTIISYKQEAARSVRRPLWQRMYLDVLMLIPAYYGYRQLQQRGTISILGRGPTAEDPFQNPLLILTPAFTLLALALLSVRLFPLLMGLVGNLFGRLPGVSGVLAMRYLTRAPRGYAGPVMLLIMTLSLATFTASMAKTLDSHLQDQVYYEVGADVRVSDLGQSTEAPAGPGGAAPPTDEEAEAPTPEDEDLNEPKWLFLPVTDYLRIPGVRGATRVSRSSTEAVVADERTPATVLGVDRLDFPGVAYWRNDYAPESLGAMMNALGANRDGLLASRSYLASQGLRVGSAVTLQLHDVSESRAVPFVVAGVLDYFPTLYPEDGAFFVANLDYLFEQQGGEFPYEVWLNTDPGTTREQIDAGITTIGLRSIISDEAPPAILVAQDRPERQGLYGLLSVGFLASALLTGLGFLFYTVISFQRRFIELGMLRAIGLSSRQMGLLLLWEQALVIGVGIAAGTGLGVLVSRYFIPFLQVRGGPHPQTPRFVVLIAWDQIQLIYLIFVVLLGLALSIVAALLLRMRIFEAVKLGEAV